MASALCISKIEKAASSEPASERATTDDPCDAIMGPVTPHTVWVLHPERVNGLGWGEVHVHVDGVSHMACLGQVPE